MLILMADSRDHESHMILVSYLVTRGHHGHAELHGLTAMLKQYAQYFSKGKYASINTQEQNGPRSSTELIRMTEAQELRRKVGRSQKK